MSFKQLLVLEALMTQKYIWKQFGALNRPNQGILNSSNGIMEGGVKMVLGGSFRFYPSLPTLTRRGAHNSHYWPRGCW